MEESESNIKYLKGIGIARIKFMQDFEQQPIIKKENKSENSSSNEENFSTPENKD